MLVYTVREGKSGNENTLQKSLPTRNFRLAGRFTYGFSNHYFAEFNFGYNGSERFDKVIAGDSSIGKVGLGCVQ